MKVTESKAGGWLEISLTPECVSDCSAQGQVVEAVKFWAEQNPNAFDGISDESLVSVLKPYGAWEDDEMKDRQENIYRVIWLAACQSKEENERPGKSGLVTTFMEQY